MSEIVESIKEELLNRCKIYNEKYGYDFWNDHIKYVVKNSVELAKKYDADIEIVELGALLHDIAMPSEIGDREQHNINGAKIANELLTKLNYPEDRKERVKVWGSWLVLSKKRFCLLYNSLLPLSNHEACGRKARFAFPMRLFPRNFRFLPISYCNFFLSTI